MKAWFLNGFTAFFLSLQTIAVLFISITTPATATAAPFTWSINIHTIDTAYDLDRARFILKEVKGLGATQVRMFLHWYELEPAPGEWHEWRLRFLDQFFTEATNQGVEVLVVLGHAPDWARKLYRSGKMNRFLEHYYLFSKEIASRFGDRLTYYNYWNEPNNDLIDYIKPQDDWLVALSGDRGVRDGDPNEHRGILNYTADYVNGRNWINQLTYTFERLNWMDPNHTVRIVAVDIYPETWTHGGSRSWEAMTELNRVLEDPSHPCFGLDAAIGETGYSSFLPGPWGTAFRRSEADQAHWYKQHLPELSKLITEYNATHRNQYVFVNLYEFTDHPSGFPYNPEAHWGLYHWDGSAKPAADVVRQFIDGHDLNSAESFK